MNKNDIQNKLKQMEQEMADLRKKLDEPELYRGWMPDKGEVYWIVGNRGSICHYQNNDEDETNEASTKITLGIFHTESEARASYYRHMAGEECKKIISKWIAKLEPGWKPDWSYTGVSKCNLSRGYKGSIICTVQVNQQIPSEWYFPERLAINGEFLAEITPHFKKWLGGGVDENKIFRQRTHFI